MLPKSMQDALSANVRRRRKELGITAEELGRRAGITGAGVRQIEIGNRGREPRFSTVLGLSAALGCTIDELMH